MSKYASVHLLLLTLGVATAQIASFPAPLTGAINCALPIRQLVCTVDTRTGFVAGLQYGPGPGYGLRSVCSRGNDTNTRAKVFYADLLQQTTWDMTNLNDPSFPTNTSGQPNLAYYFPLGALITQMIVLEAPNPRGANLGEIPAVVFRYFTPVTLAPGFAVCGNSRYAQAYLSPLTANPLPPTMPTLRSVYVNPLSASTPAFLASFQAKCGDRGLGFLGGDPNLLSVYHVKYFQKVCFAPAAQVVNLQPPDAPADRPDPSYDWDVPHTPCYWDKQASKSSPSVSCARSGEVVATGKYGIILVGQQNKPVQAVPDGNGKLAAAAFEWPMYEGSMPGAPTV